MSIGEPNYCALVVDEEELCHLKNSHLQMFKKELDPKEMRSQVVTLIVRVSAQLEQLGASFQKRRHMRVVQSSPKFPLSSFSQDPPHILFSFYVCDSNFYAMISSSSYFTRETFALKKVVEDILVDRKPLYTSLPVMPDTEQELLDLEWEEPITA